MNKRYMRILITGATGLIGSAIGRLCLQRKIPVSYLTTHRNKIRNEENYQGYFWNPGSGEIDPACLDDVGAIINLAGETIFQPWTGKGKRKILNSRLDSLEVLYNLLRKEDHEVGHLVSAGGITIYPSSFHKMYYENEAQIDTSFSAKVVRECEAAADRFENLGLRVAKIRTGLVLSDRGGALQELKRPVEIHLGAALGTGKQWQSWIHIEDLARLYLFVVERGLQGVYNAVAPNPVRNEELMAQVSETMGKKLWLPNVPAVALKFFLGEMSSIILSSQLVSSTKVQKDGFDFYYIQLPRALQNLLKGIPFSED